MRELGRTRFVQRGPRLVVLGLLLTSFAFGAGKGSKEADALFKQAVELAQAGEFVQAADKFRASYQLEPSPGALQGLAMAEEHAGKLVQAQADFVALQRLAIERKDKKRQRLAEERLAAIAPRLAKLTLGAKRSPPDGAQLRFDGSELPLSQLGVEMPADPGQHVVEGTAPDGSSFEARIQLDEGQSKTLSVEWIAKLAPPPAPAKPARPSPEHRPTRERSSSNLDVAGVVTAGVGLALVGVGTYFTVRAGKTYDDVQSQCRNDRCPGSLRSEVDSGRQQETLGRVGLVLGGAVIATGVVLYVVGSKQKRSREAEPASLGAFVGPRGVGMLGSF